jgi:hypothetical protein
MVEIGERSWVGNISKGLAQALENVLEDPLPESREKATAPMRRIRN